MTTPAEEIFDYPAMIDEAMRGVVRTTLQHVQKSNVMGDHHFYISFRTTFPGVKISPRLLERFPEEMTIVVQHQFWNLEVNEKFFSIMLSFSNIPERLQIPFAALVAFADPSVKFGLQFNRQLGVLADEEDSEPMELTKDGSWGLEPDPSIDTEKPVKSAETKAEVISLDAFRKK